MAMQTQSVFLLPPRPRVSDWALAGTGAGMALGISELLVSYFAGTPPSPPLALLIIATESLLVGALATLLGAALRTSGQVISHSGMIGATLGPLLGAVIAGTIWQQVTSAGTSAALAVSGLATALMLAVAASLAGLRIGDALERSALFPSAPFIWFLVALPLAGAERILGSELGTAISIAGLVGILVLALAVALVTFEWSRRRESRAPRSFSRVLSLLTIGAVAAAFSPWAIPWMLSDVELPALDDRGPPNILVVALGLAPSSAATGIEPSLALSGVRYAHVQPGGPFGVRELLATSDGTSVPFELAASGYAVSVIVTDPQRSPAFSGVEIDSALGAQRLLEESFDWMAGASLLTGPGEPLLAALGLGETYRPPEQIAAAAKRWLTSWRMQRAPAPFFLYVDFGATDEFDRRNAVEAGLFELLELLEQLDVDHRTAIVVASDPSVRPDGESDRPAPFAAVLRPTAAWPRSARGVRVRREIHSRDLAAALLDMSAHSLQEAPRKLPGL